MSAPHSSARRGRAEAEEGEEQGQAEAGGWGQGGGRQMGDHGDGDEGDEGPRPLYAGRLAQPRWQRQGPWQQAGRQGSASAASSRVPPGPEGDRVGLLALPDVLHGLIASWLGTRDLLELCGCSRFFNQTYAGRVRSVRLEEPYYTRDRFDDEEEQGGGHERPEDVVVRLLHRLTGLRQLRVSGQPAVLGVGAALRSASSGAVVLQQLEHLDATARCDAVQGLLLGLSTRSGRAACCVCPGLRHLLVRAVDLAPRGAHIEFFGWLLDALTGREQAGAASLLTLRMPSPVGFPADSFMGQVLSRLLLTSKACESLEALLLDGQLQGECLRVVEAYLSSPRAASLRRLHLRVMDPSPSDGRPTIAAALAGGRLPLLEELELTGIFRTGERGRMAPWASSPPAAGLVSLHLGIVGADLPAVLRAAVGSHGFPRLRTLQFDGDAALLPLVEGMESNDALPCLECLKVEEAGSQGVRRLAAFLAQGRGCSRTLRKLDLSGGRASDEAGAQLGYAIKVGGLPVLEELRLNESRSWGDATMCALVEALESGKGKSLKELDMVGTGVGQVGYRRILQAIRAGLRDRPVIRILDCLLPEVSEYASGAYVILPGQTAAMIEELSKQRGRVSSKRPRFSVPR